MADNVSQIFSQVKSKYETHGLDLELTAGGLCDVKGKGTSDVDISLFHNDYQNLRHIFTDSSIEHFPNERATIYSIPGYAREVNIYATDDMKRVEMAMKHRQNELKLNKYPLLLAGAIVLKRLGESTESAWAKALNMDGDVFEIMARDDIEDIARKEEEKLAKIMKNL